MKNLIKTSLAAAMTTVMLAAPVQAQDASQDIIVQPNGALFAQSVGQRLGRQLDRGQYPGRESGIARVTFVANSNGQTEEVSLYESSGDTRIDHAAMIAVERLNGISLPPYAQDGRQNVMATIVFARSEYEADRLIARAQRENAAILASGRLDPAVLAITVIPGSRG